MNVLNVARAHLTLWNFFFIGKIKKNVGEQIKTIVVPNFDKTTRLYINDVLQTLDLDYTITNSTLLTMVDPDKLQNNDRISIRVKEIIFPSNSTVNSLSKKAIISGGSENNSYKPIISFSWLSLTAKEETDIASVNLTGNINFYYKILYNRDDSNFVGVDLNNDGSIDLDPVTGRQIFRFQGAPYDSPPVLLGSKTLVGNQIPEFEVSIPKLFGGGFTGALYLWCEYSGNNDYSPWNNFPETTPNSWIFTDLKID